MNRPDPAGFGQAARWLAVLSAAMMVVYVLAGAGSYFQSRHVHSPPQTMRGLTAAFPSQLFVDMLALEAGPVSSGRPAMDLSPRGIVNGLFRFVTNVNPADPRTLLASELPGVEADRVVPLRSGAGGGDQGPRDYAPMAVPPPSRHLSGGEDGLREDEQHPQEHPDAQRQDAERSDGFGPLPQADPQALMDIVDNSRAAPDTGQNSPGASSGQRAQASVLSDSVKRVFIYHTHNRESFLPELQPGLRFDEAQDDEINVTLVGRRLSEKLEELGIGAVVSDTDYPSVVQNFNWNESYRYSLQTVKEAFAAHPDLKYFLDIHRDAGPRRTTTVTIDGVDYAQLYFIIGQSNPNWEQNERLASDIHNRLEEAYPGISRGIWGKQAGSGNNGEYNQSFSPGSLLIEVGGVENSLEEVYRTIDILAKVLADVIRNAERV
jgi:stage II sporulation protein P